MSLEKDLVKRSNSKCELCSALNSLEIYTVTPHDEPSFDHSIYICDTCISQLTNQSEIDANHWRCLNDSMWSEVNPVKVVAWRILNQLRSEGWPQDLLDMLYLEDDVLAWAQSGQDNNEVKHFDSNNVQLNPGDSVTLIKDLNVKGANFTAKRGTAVRNISLVRDNPEQIEGKVNGQQIIILTKYVKK